jgi:hypothetical protein
VKKVQVSLRLLKLSLSAIDKTSVEDKALGLLNASIYFGLFNGIIDCLNMSVLCVSKLAKYQIFSAPTYVRYRQKFPIAARY